MPAVRDAFHHPTFPQPAFDLPPEQVRSAYCTEAVHTTYLYRMLPTDVSTPHVVVIKS